MTDVAAQIRQAGAKNAELLSGLAATDHAPPALAEQNRYVADLKRLLAQSDAKIQNLDKRRKSDLKDHQKYRDSHMKRFAYKATGQKDKFAQRAEKEEREYFDVLQEAHQEENANTTLRGQLKEGVQQQRQLEGVAEKRKGLQTELDNLYQDIFAGPTPQFPEEDEKEKQSEVSLQFYHDTRERVEAEAQVAALLGRAQERMMAAMQYMNQALMHSRMDMFGGGTITDMMERSALSSASKFLQDAQMMVTQAQNASPFVQPLPRVNINHGNIMSDVFFDNIFTDMAFHQEIQRGATEMSRAAASLNEQVEQAKQRKQVLVNQVKQRESELETARKELQRARERAFESVSKGEVAAGGPATGGPAEDRGQAPAYEE